MSIDGMDNLNLSFIFSQDLNDIFLPTNYDNIPNEFLFESKEDLPSKHPVKFILTKQENPSVSLLQKKTIQKPSDSSVDSDNSNNGRWTKDEQKRFAEAVLKYGNDWKNIQSYVASRNITQVRSHAQKFLMKLKESNFLKDRGLDSNLSWTKVINFLTNNLTYAELKEVLFSVEQTSNKKIEIKNIKNLKKIQKKKIKKKNSLEEEKETNSKIMNDSNAQSDNTCYSCKYNSYGKNYNSDYDEDYNIKQKIIKQEEDEILQKLIECFNNSYGENTQNSSFEENSIKEDGNDNRFNFLNEIQNK
jgi:SHAQKYF class myb-like DNA-binding protein